ncbi:hypothetical protein NGM36_22690 [Streptomyces mutabilis]|uniref:hypothetical protein n=1 Tax=Streptomyces mutabilis TaxID=67332 RepID=UPI0022BA6806|nr:hypothetical protein [Streptomyces mutabilis]MCZ9352540.1 hypothetical protein [Streptomyces mutabilis]
MMKRALWQGLLVGTAGVLAMTLGEKAEQRLTGRPDSHVPARTLERLGPWSSAKFAVVRLTTDQILENATGVGAPPQTWPRRELVIDLLHKSVYAFATGAVADALAARSGPGPGQRHAALRPGRHSDVGPLPRGR